VKKQSTLALDTDYLNIIAAKHHDPFAVLGRHPVASTDGGDRITVYLPYAESVTLPELKTALTRISGTDFLNRGQKTARLAASLHPRVAR